MKSSDGPNYSFIIPTSAAKELFSIVKKTQNWKAGYNVEEDTLDGYGWEIKLKYGKLNIETEGYEAFPMDFKMIVREIQEKIEKICEIYAENYTKDGIKERMDL